MKAYFYCNLLFILNYVLSLLVGKDVFLNLKCRWVVVMFLRRQVFSEDFWKIRLLTLNLSHLLREI